MVVVMSRLVTWLVVMTIVLPCNYHLFTAEAISDETTSAIVSVTKDVMVGTELIGRIRYHYYFNGDYETDDDNRDTDGSDADADNTIVPTGSSECSDVLVVGVGTAMSVEDYDKIAESIVTVTGTTSLVVIISDHNPGRIVKLSSTLYANLSNAIRDQLHSGLVPICNNNINIENNTVYGSNFSSSIDRQQQEPQPQPQQGTTNFLIGGHSASGQAALEAAQKELYDFVPSGFVGLDPYDISEKTMDMESPLQFPTLNWGFTNTTCFVQVEKAALGAFHLSSSDSGRVLYSIDNSQNDLTHCVFTDEGCGVSIVVVCPTEEKFEWVYESVAKSVHLFVNALKTEGTPFRKEHFELPVTVSEEVFLYVNGDDGDGYGDSEMIAASTDTLIDNDTLPSGTIDSGDGVAVTTDDNFIVTELGSGSYYSGCVFDITVATVVVGWMIFRY